MSASTLRILIAVFLIAHGLVHFSLTTVPVPAPGALRTPFWPSWWREAVDPTWLASRTGLPNGVVRAFGSLLWAAVVLGLTLAGLGLMGIPVLNSTWQTTAVLGAVASLILLALYWHPWLVIGLMIDIAVLISLWQQWPVALVRLHAVSGNISILPRVLPAHPLHALLGSVFGVNRLISLQAVYDRTISEQWRCILCTHRQTSPRDISPRG